MKAPVEATLRDMYERESIERFIQGLKLSASCARELNAIYPKRNWGKVHEALNHLIASGYKLSRTKSLTRQALLQHTDQIAAQSDTSLAANK